MAAKGQDVHAKISRFLDIPDATDIIQYFESFTSKQDLEEYFYGLLDEDNEEHRQFVDEYLENWKAGAKTAKKPAIAAVKKIPEKEPNLKQSYSKPGPKIIAKRVEVNIDEPTSENHVGNSRQQPKKGKAKFQPLYATKHGYSEPVIQLSGRHKCDCEASKHGLINNCLKCGRIVCEQEGSGPCTFCGQLVCTREEQEIINRDSKTSRQLLRKLMGPGFDSNYKSRLGEGKDGGDVGLAKAQEHKNKLLEFDKTVEKRTKIIDDQSDYYTLDNLWLTKTERDAVKKRDEAFENEAQTKKTPRVTFDFAGRQIVEERSTTQEELRRTFELHMEKLESQKKNSFFGSTQNNLDFGRPVFDEAVTIRGNASGTPAIEKNFRGMRLQGAELQEMNDQGNCLSMHQPYASLLVAGLKMQVLSDTEQNQTMSNNSKIDLKWHEGRSWYSPIRGRLWIASTAQTPNEVMIKEESIRAKQTGNVDFPKNFPMGALLGCVNVVDCLPQETYREMYDPPESDSPFVFICENPQELIVKFPIRGQHKIYKLDPRIHEAAKKTLRAIEE